jgi:hypothetical protein
VKHPGGRPRKVRRSDIQYARELHALGRSWAMIAEMLGYRTGTLRAAASKLARGQFSAAQERAEPTGTAPNPSEGP